jgi:hypothetical protein
MRSIQRKIDANQSKANTILKEIKEDIKTKQAKMDAHHEKLVTIMKTGEENIEATREACLEKFEAWACLESKEPTSLEVESIAAHEEVTKEEAVVEIVRALKKWYRDLCLAVRHGT